MDIVYKILRDVPLFRHCTESEIKYLQKIGRLSQIKKGQYVDLKKANSVSVVVNGIFEIEALGKTDIVYMSPGSFFGAIPFTENRHTGRIRATVDSALLLFKAEDMYRFFLVSYKALRGYLKTVRKMGFEISDIGNLYFGEGNKIIAVYSPYSGSGKSLLTSMLGLSLKDKGRAIILDVTFGNNSIFNYFGKKVTSPISHRSDDTPSMEKVINERVEPLLDNLDILNITFGSKVKVNPDILSPVLFILSKGYKYILMDLADNDPQLRDRAFELSDKIFTLLKNKKDVATVFGLFDDTVKEGQDIYYVVNEYYSGTVREFSGGVIMERLDMQPGAGDADGLSRIAVKAVANLVNLITARKRAVVLETNLMESLFFSGFFSILSKSEKKFDIFYASSFSYIMLALYMLSEGGDDFRKKAVEFFSEDRINKFLDITFPDEYVFKESSIVKYAGELCGKSRIEMFKNIPVAMLAYERSAYKRIFSTGYLSEMMAASFLVYPISNQKKIAGDLYSSGYPGNRTRIEDLFRTDVDEILYISIDNKAEMNYSRGKLLQFYEQYIKYLEMNYYDDKISDLADDNIVLEFSEKDLRIEKIMEVSEEAAAKVMKDKGF